MANNICKTSADAESYWRKSVKRLRARKASDEGFFLITLDRGRHFTGCHRLGLKGIGAPESFAREVIGSPFLNGVGEFIVLHNRPGVSPVADEQSKARARALIVAGRPKGYDLLDYLIRGKPNEKPLRAFLRLCRSLSFCEDGPLPPKLKRATRQAKAQGEAEK